MPDDEYGLNGNTYFDRTGDTRRKRKKTRMKTRWVFQMKRPALSVTQRTSHARAKRPTTVLVKQQNE